jgi:hypothetical protein
MGALRSFPVVIRISLSYIYNLAVQLEPLEKLPESGIPFIDVAGELYGAKYALEGLDNSVFKPYLRSSLASLAQLKAAVDEQTSNPDYKRIMEPADLFLIRYTFQQFKPILLAELQVVNAYFVTQKGGFDTHSLLFWGENCFPAALATKVPEALFDAREATKSLAYELPTAVGFHTFRALESVLRKYHSHVTGGIAPPKVRNIGVYLESLKRRDAGELKVRLAIKQIADLHRNPLIHPEAVLTMEEAVSIIGISGSAIAAMLVVIPTQAPTTAIPQLPSSVP